MIVLGVALRTVGLILGVAVLWVIGVLLAVVGAALILAAAWGGAGGDRRHHDR